MRERGMDAAPAARVGQGELVLEITEHSADGRRFDRHLTLENQ
jgi:hypothetical protein